MCSRVAPLVFSKGSHTLAAATGGGQGLATRSGTFSASTRTLAPASARPPFGQKQEVSTMKCLVGRRPAQPVVFATLAMALLFGALATRSDAQVLYGSIVGNVADASKSAVPGAAVTIVHKETNLARETVTRSDGSYTFVNVQPGTYTVRVVLAGFKESVKENAPVSANAITRVDVGLEVGQLTEAVTVQSERTLLQTDSGSVTAELKSKEITSLPLGNYRNYQSLLNLVPGPTPTGFQNAVTDTPARALTTNVNGTARNNNNTRLDGT